MLGLDNPIHILFLLVIVLLVFGAKRLPEMGKSLGEGLRGFKDSISGETPMGHNPMGHNPLSHMTADEQHAPVEQLSAATPAVAPTATERAADEYAQHASVETAA
jgi:sec-independent protein translocase protein TatA